MDDWLEKISSGESSEDPLAQLSSEAHCFLSLSPPLPLRCCSWRQSCRPSGNGSCLLVQAFQGLWQIVPHSALVSILRNFSLICHMKVGRLGKLDPILIAIGCFMVGPICVKIWSHCLGSGFIIELSSQGYCCLSNKIGCHHMVKLLL